MVARGRIQNGVVVLEGQPVLPEGAVVTVVYEEPVAKKAGDEYRVEFPLVRSKHPGSLHLTNDQIADIFDEEDASAGR